MIVKIKRTHPNAVIPKYAKVGDAGLDLTAVAITNTTEDIITYDTGLAIEIPENHVGLLMPRSSIRNKGLFLTNSVGVIDSGYRGSLQGTFGMYDPDNIYEIGDRILQLLILPYPQIEFEEVEELSKTERGEGGFGSSGN